MEPRAYDQGGLLIAHPATLDDEWNIECGHHLSPPAASTSRWRPSPRRASTTVSCSRPAPTPRGI
jgi:hypothetical protein